MRVKSGKKRVSATEDGIAASIADQEEMDQRLAQLRDYLSHGQFNEALAELNDLEARWPTSQHVQYWARVLAPPVVRTVPERDPRSRSFDRERTWLRQHGREYPGCWLAVYHDRLIAADPDLGVVLTETSRLPEGERPILYWQPGRSQQK